MTSKVKLKPRFNQHEILNKVIRNDWITAIESNPDSFQALLYTPVEVTAQVEDSDYEEVLFNKLDTNQQALEYADPVIVSVLDNPDDMAPLVLESGGEAVNNFEEPMALRIGRHNVPVGSVLEWEEVATEDTTRRCWWYVHSGVALGTTLSAVIHNVIPCRDFEGMNDGE